MITSAGQAPMTARQWLVFTILAMSSIVAVLDATILSVAIPVIQADLDATLLELQWVLSGYALTFATLLVIGGRIGDLYGSRRVVIVGLVFFGIGSLLASMARNVPELIVGEAIIEGIGAALITPSTMSIMSRLFTGRHRGTAFAALGAIGGGAAAFGPVVGGYFATYHSWRWSLRINVLIAPVALLGVLLLVPRDGPRTRVRLDVSGAILVAACTFSLVFAFSQGPTFGFWEPRHGHPSGLIPGMFAMALATGVAFTVVERRKEREERGPLVPFSQLAVPRFRSGLLVNLFMGIGQYGFVLAVPVFLQQGHRLDAFETGLWLLPFGVSVFFGAQAGAWIVRRTGPTRAIRLGTALQIVGLGVLAAVMGPGVTVEAVFPGMVALGLGNGLVGGQLTNVALRDVEPARVGVAAGVIQTSRQISISLGFAIVGAVLAATSARWALALCASTAGCATAVALLMPGDDERRRVDVPSADDGRSGVAAQASR
jgi:EmrB/QacA subfamily drug resistance transporter